METYALITGASKGIGRSIAIQLASAGYNLLLISRSEPDLKNLAELIKIEHKVSVLYLAIDLSEPVAAEQIAAWVMGLNIQLSVLINNAGYGLWGNFSELSIDEQMNMLRLNIDSLVTLTYRLLPFLKKQKQAYLLNVASTAAYQALPALAVYSASKAFILSFTRAIRYELKDTVVSVTVLSPGPTDTGFAHRAGLDALAELAEKFNMSPDDVARIGLKGMFDKKAEIIPGILNKLSAYAAKHLFKSLVERISAGLYKNKK